MSEKFIPELVPMIRRCPLDGEFFICDRYGEDECPEIKTRCWIDHFKSRFKMSEERAKEWLEKCIEKECDPAGSEQGNPSDCMVYLSLHVVWQCRRCLRMDSYMDMIGYQQPSDLGKAKARMICKDCGGSTWIEWDRSIVRGAQKFIDCVAEGKIKSSGNL